MGEETDEDAKNLCFLGLHLLYYLLLSKGSVYFLAVP